MINHCNTCPTSVRGLCCWISIFDGRENFVIYPCKYLSTKTKRCTVYKKRFNVNKKCWTIEKALKNGGLPEACKYAQESDIPIKVPYKTKNQEIIKLWQQQGMVRKQR